MKGLMVRTIVLGTAIMALALSISFIPTFAQYPERPVQILVGYPAGGPADLSARAMAEAAKPFFPKPFAVVNKPGGSGVLATNELIHSAPDGYTLGHVSISHMCWAPHLAELPYKGPQGVQFIISCVTAQEALTVRADSPWKSFKELLEYAKANPGKGRFPPSAYAFVLAALERCQVRRPVRGHISGEELARACRYFALEEYGLTAGTVLLHWGLRQTRDIGVIVYDLIEAGLLVSQPEDRIEDFDGLFDFADAFERGYPWTGVQQNGGGR